MQYIKKRHFDPRHGPILAPTPRPIYDAQLDLRSATFEELVQHKIVQEGDEFLVLILPDGMAGSEMKAKFTKIVQQNMKVEVQCLFNATCRKLNACLGTFEDIMIKFGNVPYMIDPGLAASSPIKPDSCWTWGVDVSHVRDKPSVACLSISSPSWARCAGCTTSTT